jgi:hypothetical protein
VSCTREGGERTLVYRYVVTGSVDDGPRQETVVARGRIVIELVRVQVAGRGTVTVPLQPGPVECS